MTKIITDAAALTKAITKASKDSMTLEGNIQLCLASSVFFAVKDGNIQPLTALFTTVSKGVRRAAMQAWALEFAPVLLNTGTDAKEAPFSFSRDKVEALTEAKKPTAEQAIAAAERGFASNWADHKPEQLTPEFFDVRKMLDSLVKQAATLQKKGSKPKGADLLTKVQALIAAPSASEEPAPL
jgi:hypothetical protein